MPVLGQLDLNDCLRACRRDRSPAAASILIMDASRRGGGDGAGAAGVGLADAAFMDAHGDVLRPKLAYRNSG